MAGKVKMMGDLLYGDLLTTPGYDVEFAVGTTYSLDFKALLIVPYALGMFGDFSERTSVSPLPLLESIRRCSDKFVIYCHRGGIHKPHETFSFYPLLEDSIVEVFDKTNPMANFHPKLWVIKEINRENRDNRQIKVIVLSKNLSIDNNIDVAVSLTGRVLDNVQTVNPKHQPLRDLLAKMADYARGEKRRRTIALADELQNVESFEVDESHYERGGYDFVPYFFGKGLHPTITFPDALQGQSLMTVSPFIDDETIAAINNRISNSGRNVLVTRYAFVSEEVMRTYNWENGAVYVVADQVINNDYTPMDLHAKSYFVSWPKRDPGHYVFMGSANATHAAFHRNTELLIRLKLKNGQCLFDKFESDFLDKDSEGESLLYERITTPNNIVAKKEYSVLEKQIRQLLCADFKATVIKNETGLYDVRITSHYTGCNIEATLAPLLLPTQAKPLQNEMLFKDIPLFSLSEFYVLEGKDSTAGEVHTIKIPTKGIPPERNDAIFRNIVDSKDKFYSYIALMLCDDPNEYMFEKEQLAEQLEHDGSMPDHLFGGGIYEQLLKVAASDPSRLERVEEVLQIVKDQSFVSDFKELFDRFKPLIPKLKQLLS